MNVTVNIKVPARTKVGYTMVAKKVELRIPYTMIFNDGSELTGSLTHRDCLDISTKTEVLERLPGFELL